MMILALYVTRMGLTTPALLGQRSLEMTAANPPVQAASPYKGLLTRHPLLFFIIAYAGSWLVWMPVVLSEGDGVGLLPFSSPLLKIVLMPAGGYLGPVLSAFIMTGMTEG